MRYYNVINGNTTLKSHLLAFSQSQKELTDLISSEPLHEEIETGSTINVNASDAWPAKLSLTNIQWASEDKNVTSFQLKWGETLSAKRTVSTFEASTIVEGLITQFCNVELGIDNLWVSLVSPAVGASYMSLNVKGTLVFPLVLNGNFDYCVEVELA